MLITLLPLRWMSLTARGARRRRSKGQTSSAGGSPSWPSGREPGRQNPSSTLSNFLPDSKSEKRLTNTGKCLYTGNLRGLEVRRRVTSPQVRDNFVAVADP